MLEQLTYVQIGDRLNISSEGARAIVKRNRLPRADLLARSHEKLDIQLKNLRLHLQAGRQAAAPRTLGDWWRWLRASG
jgi:hypothetical protein